MSSKIRPLWHNFTYFQHQIDGVKWMLDKEITGTVVSNRDNITSTTVYGGIQCDEMGLGKTIQITSVIINNPLPKTLLIAPLAMIETWSSVCQKAGLIVYEVSKKDKDPWKIMNPDSHIPRHFMKFRPSVYITNYEKLYTNPSIFKQEWNRVVLDEAHKIRNGDGDIARYARKLQSPIRWAVTGTPLVNSLKDVVSLLAFLGVPYSPLWRWEPRFLRILPELLIHRSLDSLRSIIKNAPPVPQIHTISLPFLTEEEEEFYYGVQGMIESKLNTYQKDIISSAEAFKLLLRLRQISVHPQVYINAKHRESSSYSREDWYLPSTKLEAIKDIIKNDNDDKIHKYIIFCQFNDEMLLLQEYLYHNNLASKENILLYNGSMNQMERTEVLKKSKETTETTIMLLQLQAGGVGLNLQEYDRIIFVSPYWTSSLIDQAIARAVRMGQTETVKVYHLQLKAEHESSINIDILVNSKAEEKRKMLQKLFSICENNGVNSLNSLDE
jgi:SNF2 family DNA or RNA helicase